MKNLLFRQHECTRAFRVIWKPIKKTLDKYQLQQTMLELVGVKTTYSYADI